jgi:glucuronosyltransferase
VTAPICQLIYILTDVIISAHPNIRLFITQGGLQSMGEAVQNAVPLVGIPFMGDQGYNVRKMVSAGIGLKLDFHEATTYNLLKTLNTVLDDPR